MRKFKVELDCGTKLTVHPPTVRQFFEERAAIKTDADTFRFIAAVYSRNDENITFTPDDVLDKFTSDDYFFFTNNFMDWLTGEKKNDPN